jgi:deoxyadenosine/deoxycytidine kinase
MRQIIGSSEGPATRQYRIALAGPCGAGKSTLAALLAARYEGLAVVHEAGATPDIEVDKAPSPASVDHFQRLMSNWRREQTILNSSARVLLFDRTLEEDREVFLQLYYRLGYIDSALLDSLTKVSQEVEFSIGIPDGIIVLTAAPEVLRDRLTHAQQQRPPWLVQHIGLQHELYCEWIAKKRDSALILDTASVGSSLMCGIAMHFIEMILAGNRPSANVSYGTA